MNQQDEAKLRALEQQLSDALRIVLGMLPADDSKGVGGGGGGGGGNAAHIGFGGECTVVGGGPAAGSGDHDWRPMQGGEYCPKCGLQRGKSSV